MIRASVALLLVGILLYSAFAGTEPAAKPGLLAINDVEISGAERIAQMRPDIVTATVLARFRDAIRHDTMDEIVFRTHDGAIWIIYGAQMILYTRNPDRITTAAYNGAPIDVILIDDENDQIDLRPRLSRKMAVGLAGIAGIGLFVGVGTGLRRRRFLPGQIRDPMFDHSLFGLAVGVVIALLIYGLSGRRLDVDSLFAGTSDNHLRTFLLRRDQG